MRNEKCRMKNEDNERKGWGMINVGWGIKIKKGMDEEWEM